MIIDITSNVKMTIPIGRQYENDVTRIEFIADKWREMYDGGSLAAVVMRPGDADPYPIDLVGGVWTVSAADTAKEGNGQIQLSWIKDETIKKSRIYEIIILPSMNAATIEPPEPYETYIDQITETAAQISADMETIVALAPEIKEDADYVRDNIDQIHTDAGTASNSAYAATRAKEDAVSAKNVAVSAEQSAKGSAESALRNAEQATHSAEDAAISAQSAFESAETVADMLESIDYTDTNNDGNVIITMGGV